MRRIKSLLLLVTILSVSLILSMPGVTKQGKEVSEITVTDSAGRTVTVPHPPKRVVVTFRQGLELLRAVGVSEDRIVGVESLVQSSGKGRFGVNYKAFFPEYQDKPTVGLIWEPNVERIITLNPDLVVLIYGRRFSPLTPYREKLNKAGIPTIQVYGGVWGKRVKEEAEMLGRIFNKEDPAEKFIDFYEKVLSSIQKKIEKISEGKRPEVYFESAFGKWRTAGKEETNIGFCGGKQILAPQGQKGGSVDPEAVIKENPQVIIKAKTKGTGSHLKKNELTQVKEARQEMMNRPELKTVKAVKENQVYILSSYLLNYGPASGLRGFLGRLYLAKLLHPEIDLVPEAVHQRYLSEFQGLNINLDKQGVFVYPKPWKN